MKKITKVKVIIITIILMLSMRTNIVFADVGSFESYDSGGSSWDSGSSWSSSSSDWGSSSSWGSDYGDSSSVILFGGGSKIGGLIIWIIIIAIIAYVSWHERKYKNRRNNYNPLNYQHNTNTEISAIDGKWAEEKVKKVDELFNKEEFLAWVKDVFVKMQTAWTARDWSVIRVFETNELFEQHKTQLQGYIDRKQINVMDRICVEGADLMSFKQQGNKDIMEVKLKSKMQDYIIDEETKEVIRGEVNREIRSTYKLTFIRTTGVKTTQGSIKVNTTNCPNCGAPTEISSSGKCEYCGSVITTGEFGWVLSNLEKIG